MATFDELLARSKQQSTETLPVETPSLEELAGRAQAPAPVQPSTSTPAPTPTSTPPPVEGPDPLEQLAQREDLKSDPLGQLAIRAQPDLDTSGDKPTLLDENSKIFQIAKSYTDMIKTSLAGRAVVSAARTAGNVLKAPGELAEVHSQVTTGKPYEYGWDKPLVVSAAVGLKDLISAGESYLPDAPKTDHWWEQIPEAAGSAVPFIFGGWALGGVGLAGAAASAGLGAAAGASSQFEEAQAMGATPEQQAIAYAGGATLGLSEGLPGKYFIGRFNALSKGKLLEFIEKYNLNKQPSPVWEAVQSFFLEGGQEGFQTAGSNYIASDLAGYAPDRSLGENFWGSVLSGGAVGSMLGYGLARAREYEKDNLLKEFARQREERRASGDLINSVWGDFTDIETLVQLRKMEDDAYNFLMNEGKEFAKGVPAGDEFAAFIDPKDFVGKTITPYIDIARQKPRYIGDIENAAGDSSFQKFSETPVNDVVEKALPQNDDGSPLTIRQALLKTPVVTAAFRPYDDLLKLFKDRIKEQKEFLADPKNLKDTVKVKEAQEQLSNAQNNYNKVLEKKAIGNKILTHVKDYVSAFQQVFYPDEKILVTPVVSSIHEAEIKAKKRKRPFGSAGYTKEVRLDPNSQETVNVHTLFVDVETLAEDLAFMKEMKMAPNWGELRHFYGTLNHELGHTIATRFVANIHHEIYHGATKEDQRNAFNFFSALVKDYNDFIKTIHGDSKLIDLLKQKGTIEYAKGVENANPGDELLAKDLQGYGDYYLSFDEFFAELTARYATQGKIKELGFVESKYFDPLLKQFQDLYGKLPSFAQNLYGGNWLKFLEHQTISYKILQLEEAVTAAGSSNLIQALKGGVKGMDPNNFEGVQQHLDRWHWGLKVGLNLTQMVKEFPHIPQWGYYNRAVESWHNYQRTFQAKAVEIMENWRSLGKVENAQLSEVLFEEGFSRKRLPENVLAARLNDDALVVYQQVREHLDYILSEMEATAIADATKSHQNEEELQAEIAQIKEDFGKMRGKGYFPFVRFGQYTIVATAKEDLTYNGNDFKKGQLITFPSFETEGERNKALDEIKKELGNKATLAYGKMKETEYIIQGMPRALIRSLRNKLEAAGELSEETARIFDKAIAETTPFSNFRKHFIRKKGVLGYSEDALRSYAHYVRASAGHISRVKFNDDMQAAIAGMQNTVEQIVAIGGNFGDRQNMVDWLKRHFSYIMNPANEFAALRGVGFVVYLGANVKSAFVNSMQIMQVVYPYLAARYGDAQAVASLTKATHTLRDWFTNRDKYVSGMNLFEKPEWQKKLAYTVGFKEVSEGVPSPIFTTDAGDVDLWKNLTEEAEAKFYDLSSLNIAEPSEAVNKAIVEKSLELTQEALATLKDPSLGQELLLKENIIKDFLVKGDFSKLTQKFVDAVDVKQGARALGYDGIYVANENNVVNVKVLQNAFKVKEISKKLWNINKNNAHENIPEDKLRHARMYAQGLSEGWIDQSLATELAIAASENNLDRGLHLPSGRRYFHNVSKWSALPFHLVEKMNRYITATAAYDLEYKKSGSHTKAVLAAKQANYSANYENSRWNRPEFLRGKKSAALLFTNFLQNSLYFAIKDPGARRCWLMMLMLAGVMGLPGADDVKDLVNFAATYLNKNLGIANPKVNIEHEAREFLNELSLNPDLILHGISQNSFGLGHVGELTGIPIPRFDLSGSLGMGNILPLTEIPSMMLQSTPEDTFMAAMASAGGASGNFVEDIYRGLFSPSPDGWKRAEKLIPMTSAANVIKAARLATRGEETTASGRVIASFEPFDTRAKLELLGQGLGFMPTRLSVGWEREIALQDQIRYYKVQQSELLQQHNWALYNEDREAAADVRAKIREYNKQVPFKEMGITGDTMKASARAYIKNRVLGQVGVVQERKMRRLEKAIEAEYLDPWGDTKRKDEADGF